MAYTAENNCTLKFKCQHSDRSRCDSRNVWYL